MRCLLLPTGRHAERPTSGLTGSNAGDQIECGIEGRSAYNTGSCYTFQAWGKPDPKITCSSAGNSLDPVKHHE